MKKRELQLLIPIQDNPYYKDKPEYFLELKTLIESQTDYIPRLLKTKKYQPIKQWILQLTSSILNDDFTIATRCYWILNGLVDFPKCNNEYCNHKLDYMHNKKHKPVNVNVYIGYAFRFCSTSCARLAKTTIIKAQQTNIANGHSPTWTNRDKAEHTMLQKYGEKHFNNREKCRQTKLERYNDEFWNNVEKANATKAQRTQQQNIETNKKRCNTMLEQYGYEYSSQIPKNKIENVQKIRKTTLDKHGVDWPTKRQDVKDKTDYYMYHDEFYDAARKTCLEKYNVEWYVQSKEYKERWKDPEYCKTVNAKQIETKRKNGTLNSSSTEKLVFEHLCKLFFPNDVEQQYRSDKYPFNCDFYIKSLDLYIECNFHWTHGGHFFDATNVDDQAKVKKWKDKGTKFYDTAVNVWTVRDIKKQQIAIDNNLNYVVFWSIDEALSWIQQLPEVNKTITT